MTLDPRPLGNALRAVDPARADLQTALIGALNRRVIHGLNTVARLASERDRRAATAWIQFSTRSHVIAIAPLLIDGALARVSGQAGRPDAAGAAASLARIEPLIAALELILGDELHPAGLESDVDHDAVLIRLDASTVTGEMRNRVLIAVPLGATLVPLELPAIPPGVMAGLKLRWTARLAGPSIPARRIATLGIGDLILLGIGPHVARLTLPGRNDHPRVRIDPIERALILQENLEHSGTVLPQAGEPATQPPGNSGIADVRVQTVLEIVGASLTAAELATLGQGSVLPLPSNNGTITVRVIAGDTAIGDGELVAIGDGFGVLMTAIQHSPEG
jgi:flagellar motor switch/type III secretory pathway protein FliN